MRPITKDRVKKAEAKLIQAAMLWHYWLEIGTPGADYRKYCTAFKVLQRACTTYKKATGRAFLKDHGI
jgi:hypothetical protein